MSCKCRTFKIVLTESSRRTGRGRRGPLFGALAASPPEAISKRAVLRSVWFMSEQCDEFEMSYELPWDEYHSYDVEFESGEATCCAVNG